MLAVDQVVGVHLQAEVEQLLQQVVVALELDQVQRQHRVQQTQEEAEVLEDLMDLVAMVALAVQE